MGREGREPRSERRRAKGVDRERLAAAEAQIDALLAAKDELSGDIERTKADLLRLLEAQNAAVAEQHVALLAQTKEDYRRQVGVLDIVRRQQKRQDETFSARVEAAESTISEFSAAQSDRMVRVEDRAARLEEMAAQASARLDSFGSFQGDLGNIIERISNAIRSIREAVESLAGRTEATEALGRQQLADHAALREQVVTASHAHEALSEIVRRALATLDALDQQTQALAVAVTPLGPVPDQLAGITEALNTMNDRVIAAELVLNQRSDLDMQLERAEDFERVLAEVDPSSYATRDELERLRQQVAAIAPNHHRE